MANRSEYTADRDLFLDKDGNLVEANDPKKLTKLVGLGGTLLYEDALKYGLVDTQKKARVGSEPTTTQAAVESASSAVDQNTASGDIDETDLESLTVPRLKELAETEEVDLTGITLKADIIAAIQLKRESGGQS